MIIHRVAFDYYCIRGGVWVVMVLEPAGRVFPPIHLILNLVFASFICLQSLKGRRKNNIQNQMNEGGQFL